VEWIYLQGGQVIREPRPALLLSDSDYVSEDVTNGLPFAFITGTRVEGAQDMLDLIKDEDPEFPLTTLTKTSYIYFRQVQEIDRIRGVLYHRGKLGPNNIALAKEILRAIERHL
jgi:hypothetical protein